MQAAQFAHGLCAQFRYQHEHDRLCQQGYTQYTGQQSPPRQITTHKARQQHGKENAAATDYRQAFKAKDGVAQFIAEAKGKGLVHPL